MVLDVAANLTDCWLNTHEDDQIKYRKLLIKQKDDEVLCMHLKITTPKAFILFFWLPNQAKRKEKKIVFNYSREIVILHRMLDSVGTI